ncbi:MAG: hypothetical protein ACU85E_17300, partial [Gammaproteobacteria bacterium]
RNWLYAPNIPAMRCEQCKLVFFKYDNNEIESPEREIIASVIIGLGLIGIGVFLAASTIIIGGNSELWSVYLIKGLVGVFSLIVAVLGFLFLKHVVVIKRPNSNRV